MYCFFTYGKKLQPLVAESGQCKTAAWRRHIQATHCSSSRLICRVHHGEMNCMGIFNVHLTLHSINIRAIHIPPEKRFRIEFGVFTNYLSQLHYKSAQMPSMGHGERDTTMQQLHKLICSSVNTRFERQLQIYPQGTPGVPFSSPTTTFWYLDAD